MLYDLQTKIIGDAEIYGLHDTGIVTIWFAEHCHWRLNFIEIILLFKIKIPQ